MIIVKEMPDTVVSGSCLTDEGWVSVRTSTTLMPDPNASSLSPYADHHRPFLYLAIRWREIKSNARV